MVIAWKHRCQKRKRKSVEFHDFYKTKEQAYSYTLENVYGIKHIKLLSRIQKYNVFTATQILRILNLSGFYLNFEELYRDLIQIKIVVRTSCFPIFRIIFQCCYIKSLYRILNIEIRTALINLIVCYCDNIIAGEKIRRYFQLFICRFVSPRGFNYHSY